MSKMYYKYYDSPVGILEICTNENELVSILYVDEKKEDSVKNSILDKVINQLDEYFLGKRTIFDIEFKLKGTEFQERVWNALTEIEYGETASYKDIAINVGNEKAVRAIGNANSKNIINIVVPCHRVIGANNRLVGYGGGLGRKAWLLEHEKRIKK